MSERVRLAVSNIAWESTDDAEVAPLLRALGVTGVEIAPTKWRSTPTTTSAPERAAYRRQWEARGLPIVAMQALLFGQPQLQLFGSASDRRALLDYLRAIVDLGADLGAAALVFGSPKNRVRGALSPEAAMEIATEFFAALGAHAAERGTTVCLEANPPEYGCDFMTTTAEAIDCCRRVNSPGVRVNGDLGGMTLSGDDVRATIQLASPFLGHFHASEPHLAELGTASDHAGAGRVLRELEYSGWVSVEMRAVTGPEAVEAVRRAAQLAGEAY